MLSVFRQVGVLPRPLEWGIENFCALIFDELDENPTLEAHVTEIRHYKEKENLEHEFLLAFISHAQRQYILRLERSTSRQRRSFLQKITQTSSSILPALDMARISPSIDMLTSGMDRGDSIRVATLALRSSSSFTLGDLCVILSFFPNFSPVYKLREEQCYWFCDVVLSSIRSSCDDAATIQEEGHRRAGKFGRLSIQLSASTRNLFVKAYAVARALGRNLELDNLPQVLVEDEAVDSLVSMLAVPSNRLRLHVIVVLMHIAEQSTYHQMVVKEAGAAEKLFELISSTSPSLRAHAAVALVVIDESLLRMLNSAQIDTLAGDLLPSLSSSNEVVCRRAASALRVIASANEGSCAFASLISSLSIVRRQSHHIILEAITSCFKQGQQPFMADAIVTLSNLFSSPACTRTLHRQIAKTLVIITRNKALRDDILCYANIEGMLLSGYEDLVDVLLLGPRRQTVDIFFSLPALTSFEIQTVIVLAIIRLVEQSQEHYRMISEAGTSKKLINFIPSATPELKLHLHAALQVTMDSEFVRDLPSADIGILAHFLSPFLYLNDPVISLRTSSMLSTIASVHGNNPAVAALVPGLSSELVYPQSVAIESIASFIEREESLTTDELVVPLSNLFASSTNNPYIHRRIAQSLVTIMRRTSPSKEVLCRSAVGCMLSSEFGKLKGLVLKRLCEILPSEKLGTWLLETGCLFVVEQLFISHPDGYHPHHLFRQLLMQIKTIHSYDERLPRLLIKISEGGNIPRVIHHLVGLSEEFCQELCRLGGLKTFVRLASQGQAGAVAHLAYTMYRWSSCRTALRNASLLPTSDSHPMDIDSITIHLRNAFSEQRPQIRVR